MRTLEQRISKLEKLIYNEEYDNLQPVNLMIGRFQPFTNGHYKCIEYAYKMKHVPTVIAMINTPYSKVDAKHPFPSNMLLPMYKKCFSHDALVEDIVLVNSANIVIIGNTFKENGYKICSWTCGTDRIVGYNRMATDYHDQAELSDDFQMLEVPRTDDDISATKVREALLNDDADFFLKMTPFNIKDFNTLQEQIKSVIY